MPHHSPPQRTFVGMFGLLISKFRLDLELKPPPLKGTRGGASASLMLQRSVPFEKHSPGCTLDSVNRTVKDY